MSCWISAYAADALSLLLRCAPVGVLHAAGVLLDKMMRTMSAGDVDAVSGGGDYGGHGGAAADGAPAYVEDVDLDGDNDEL